MISHQTPMYKLFAYINEHVTTSTEAQSICSLSAFYKAWSHGIYELECDLHATLGDAIEFRYDFYHEDPEVRNAWEYLISHFKQIAKKSLQEEDKPLSPEFINVMLNPEAQKLMVIAINKMKTLCESMKPEDHLTMKKKFLNDTEEIITKMKKIGSPLSKKNTALTLTNLDEFTKAVQTYNQLRNMATTLSAMNNLFKNFIGLIDGDFS